MPINHLSTIDATFQEMLFFKDSCFHIVLGRKVDNIKRLFKKFFLLYAGIEEGEGDIFLATNLIIILLKTQIGQYYNSPCSFLSNYP